MNYFDEEYKKQDNLDKKLFEESYKKQIKLSKKVFKILGCIFFAFVLILLILIFVSEEFEIIYSLIPFGILGIVFLTLGFVIPETTNYEKIKKKQKKYGYINYYEISAAITILEEKNALLEKKISDLENEIRKLKQN